MSVAIIVQDRDLSALSSQDLMHLERSIAEQFMGGLPWGSIAWAFTNLALWLSLWPLTLSGVPEQARTPILSIAMATGFGSLAPFNRAFKASEGVTPSEYRRAALLGDQI